MNVASLKLCKELYELSGWVDVEAYYEYYPIADKHALRHSAPGNAFAEDRILPDYIFPAYDLGYLLRKLPNYCRVERKGSTYVSGYTAKAEIDLDTPFGQEADTPEDAACKLAIELFKQGVLAAPTHQEAGDKLATLQQNSGGKK